MAAHILDSFVVEIGLDASKFDAQQRGAVERTKQNIDNIRKLGGSAEDGLGKLEDAIGSLRTQALEMFAAFTGGKGLISFSSQLMHADASLGRLERNIGVSASTINAWQGAARIFGGDAKTMAQTFTSVSDAFAGWKIGAVSPMIADLRAISTAGGKIIDVNKGVEQSFLDLSENLKAIHDRGPDGPAMAGLLGRRIGLDPAMFDLLIKGPEGLQKVLDYVKKIGVATQEDTDTFGELEKRFGQMGVKAESLGRKLLGGENGVASYIMGLADVLNMTPAEAWTYLNNPNRREMSREARKPGGTGPGSNLFGANPSGAPATGAFVGPADKEKYIREEAVRQGQNPDVWVKLAKSEGFNQYQGDLDATGKPTSFGSMQLHYPGIGRNTADGLGTRFTQETGLDARDPATEREQIAWSMRYARTHGLGDWHGWKGAAFANMEGVGSTTSTSSSSSTHIDTVNVYPPPGTDGKKMAEDFQTELRRRTSYTSQANQGQN